MIAGRPLGDVWRHSAAPGDGLVPFHKLTQWLAYSLLEVFEDAGLIVTGAADLTGLPEYRNGGLLLDLGVLRLRDPALAQVPLPVDHEAVVEWRALTVALLDRLAPADPPRAWPGRGGAAPVPHPGRRHLGRWPRHRPRAAPRRRATLDHHQRRDRILTVQPNVTLLSHPLVQHKLTLLRPC